MIIAFYNGGVVKPDNMIAIPDGLRNALKQAVGSLKAVHPSRCDWHPGSGLNSPTVTSVEMRVNLHLASWQIISR